MPRKVREDAGTQSSSCQGLDSVFREQHQALVRFLMARLHSMQEANEVAQEAYVRLLTHDNPEAMPFLRARLYRTAENIATDRLQRQQVPARIKCSASERTAQHTRGMEQLLLAEEGLVLIEECLRELPPICQKVFILARLENIGVEEIAQRLCISRPTVLRYIARALEHCQQRLAEAAAKQRAGR